MSNAGKTLRKWPQLRGLRGNAWSREYRRLRSEENIAAGLTCRGERRRLKRWPKLHRKSRREQNLFHERQRRARLAALGLTCRGTPRKYRQYPELNGLDVTSRKRARFNVWYGGNRNRTARRKIGALLKGDTMAAKLGRAA